MSVQAQYLDWVLEQLAGLGRVTTRRMFGGVGLYSGELFFGLIDDDTLFFKADSSNSAGYLARRMPRFMAPAEGPASDKGYFQVPADIIEEGETLVAWARQSVAVALTAQAAKSKPRAKSKPKPKRARKSARKKKR
jgi:DNA transformation protein